MMKFRKFDSDKHINTMTWPGLGAWSSEEEKYLIGGGATVKQQVVIINLEEK